MHGERKPLRRKRPVGAGHESAMETAALFGTESPAVARRGVCVSGASIACLGALGEWRSGTELGVWSGHGGLALVVLHAEDTDIGVL